MELIDNFSLLSKEEQRQFAEKFLQLINESKAFSNEAMFTEIDSTYRVEANEMDGSLDIFVYLENIDYWRSFETEDLESASWEWNYSPSSEQAVAREFKTLEASIEGYKVELIVDDVPNEEQKGDGITIEDHQEHSEDVGIGSYEFWGEVGYDSRIHEWESGSGTVACHSDALIHFNVSKQ